jgi:hypothetical protein
VTPGDEFTTGTGAEAFVPVRGNIVGTAAFTVNVTINLSAYAAYYGDDPGDSHLPLDAVESFTRLLLDCVPPHLHQAFLVRVREDERTYPKTIG